MPPVSDSGPFGGDPFRGMPFFGDLARMLQGQGPISWDAAKQFAHMIATEGRPETNVDPLQRIKLEELTRIAEIQVAGMTGLPTSVTGRLVTVAAVTPGQWAARALEDYRPLFEKLAGALASGATLPGDDVAALDDDEAQEFAVFSGLMQMLSPMMLGMSAGSMVGHLSRRCFGQYDLPIPRRASDELQLVIPTVDAFANDWSLPGDDLRLWLCAQELVHHAVLGVPHVRDALSGLMGEYVAGFRPNPNALQDKLASLDPSSASSLGGMQEVFSDPEVLLGAMQSPAQEALRPRLDALVAVIVGFVDHTMDAIGARLLGDHRRLAEALRRHRVEADPSDRFVERLLGLSLGQDQVDRGSRFVAGVVERSGAEGLARLWGRAQDLPTPAEVDAPGLWLARIDLPG
jgi:putative hydrolase